MSSIIFTGTINNTLKRLREKYGVVVFADDCVLICDEGQAEEALSEAKERFADIGLTLNDDKCEILSRMNSIEFLS